MILARHFPLLIAIVLSLAACSKSDSQTTPKVRQEGKSEAKEIAARAAIEKFVRKSSADVSWMTSIAQKHASFFQPIYTVDLENLWLDGRPIAFVGRLQDVATNSESNYLLIVTASDVQLPELRLEILCPKTSVAPILAQISADKTSIQPGGIVIAATITKVKSETEPGKEGAKTVFIGQGRCTEIALLGDSMDLMFSMNSTPGK